MATVLLCLFVFTLPASAQYQEQLRSSLENHTVVLRNFYTDDKLTFGPDGKLTSAGTPGFGPTDGSVYLQRIDFGKDRVTLLGVRPVLVWDQKTTSFISLPAGRPVKIIINVPPAVSADKAFAVLLGQILIRPNELQQFQCGPNDKKLQDILANHQASSAKSPNPPGAASPGELTQICLPGGEHAYRLGAGAKPPKALKAVDPTYPEPARRAAKWGTAVLALIVDDKGSPSTIVVTRPVGSGLDLASIEAVRQWRFEPATFQGQPVPVLINVEVNFRFFQ